MDADQCSVLESGGAGAEDRKRKNNLIRIKSLFKKNNLIKSNYYSNTLHSE